ncbi:virion structural protein [Erwinia phage phiEaH2]|uniref:Putative virion structural protein n=1 Tax=Erwinia phage phiEaH2 TaxID=1029988 RepID=J7KC83_9CAUD|nr:virion structural protein [Erwinia phage phiEaH2]AFQ96611.1 putative virion structural protein [Erwinia phage phiEaH2]
MQFYSSAALQLIYDQVNRDNPDLPVKLTQDVAALKSGPTANSANGRNTRAVFVAYPGKGYRGEITLYYDRVNLGQIFTTTLRPLISLPTTVKTLADALPYLNDLLGLSLTVEDLQSPTMALAPDTTVKNTQAAIVSTSPAFQGGVNFSYQAEGLGYYPNSGPGPKTLRAGNTLMGYFGKVDASELYTHAELYNLTLKGTPATLYAGTEGWYKFFYQGGIIYLPVTPLAYNVNWSIIYNAGIAYGIEGVGAYPTVTPVNQSKILTKSLPEGKFYLRPRLPTASVKDPMTATTGTLPIAEYVGSILELMLKVRDGTWESNTEGRWNDWAVFLNSIAGTTGSFKLVVPLSKNGTNVVKTNTATAWYWWPVLELVDTNTTLLKLEDLTGKLETSFTPIVASREQKFALAPAVFSGPKTTLFQPVVTTPENSLAIAPPIPLLPKTVDFRPVVATGSQVDAPTKINLSSLNGELSGFN